MAHRRFVELDTDGNVAATLQSDRCPGDDPAVIPDHMREVDADDPRDWHRYRWNGSAFVERTDLVTADAADTVDARLTRIEALLATLTP